MSKHNHGIITKKDRELLCGRYVGTDTARRSLRNNLKDRIRGAISDFPLLFTRLPRDQREQVILKKIDSTTYPYLQSHADSQPYSPGMEWEYIWLSDTEALRSHNELESGDYIGTGGTRQMFAFMFLSLYEAFNRKEVSEKLYVHILEELLERSLQDAFGKHERVVDATVRIELSDVDVDLDKLVADFLHGSEAISDTDVEHLMHARLIHKGDMDAYITDYGQFDSQLRQIAVWTPR